MSRARAPNDTAPFGPSHRAGHGGRRGRRAGRHALLQQAEPARAQGPLRGRRRGHRQAGDRSTTSRRAAVIDLPNDLLAELARDPQRRRRQAGALRGHGADRRASTCSPATTTCSRRCSTWAAPAGSWWLAPRRARDAPHDRRAGRTATRSTRSCADVFEALFVTTSPTPVKAALNMLGRRGRRPAAAARRGRPRTKPR